MLLETAWGCGGSVHDVLLLGWAVGNKTADVLRINARSHACEVPLKAAASLTVAQDSTFSWG